MGLAFDLLIPGAPEKAGFCDPGRRLQAVMESAGH